VRQRIRQHRPRLRQARIDQDVVTIVVLAWFSGVDVYVPEGVGSRCTASSSSVTTA